jgi:hypothetical protein
MQYEFAIGRRLDQFLWDLQRQPRRLNADKHFLVDGELGILEYRRPQFVAS